MEKFATSFEIEVDLGFELADGGAGLNLTQVQMKARIREFGNKLRGGGVGVFYYAGM